MKAAPWTRILLYCWEAKIKRNWLKQIITLCILLGMMGYVLGQNQATEAAGAANDSKTWSTDADWNDWTQKENLELIGGDGGARLKEKSDGHFETSGSMTYKYSPGNTVTWINQVIEKDSQRTNRRYIFMPYFYYKDSQEQLKTPTSSFLYDYRYVAKFDTGDPAAGDSGRGNVSQVFTVGCNPEVTGGLEEEEVWVANRGGGGTGNLGYYYYYTDPLNKYPMTYYAHTLDEARAAGTCSNNIDINSVSHIKKDGTVTTKKIVNGDTGWTEFSPSSIAVDGDNRIWVLITREGRNTMYIIKGDTFDNPGNVEYDGVIDNLPRMSNFVFDKDFKHLFAIATNKIYSLDTSTRAYPSVIYDGTGGSGTFRYLTNDNYGNIWASQSNNYRYANSKILRIDNITKNIKIYDMNNYSTDYPYSVVSDYDGKTYNSYLPESTYATTNKQYWEPMPNKIEYGVGPVIVMPDNTIAFKNNQWYQYYNWNIVDRYTYGRWYWTKGPSLGPMGGIGYAKVQNNSSTDNIAATSDTDSALATKPTIFTSIADFLYSGTVGYDKDKNIWSPTAAGAVYYQRQPDASYTVGGSYGIAGSPAVQNTAVSSPLYNGGASWPYAMTDFDFFGNNLDNSLSDIRAYFSKNEIKSDENETTLQGRSDVFQNVNGVGTSDQVYIKVFFTGNGLASPILKSLKIEYNSDQNPAVYLEKWTLKNKVISGTFQPKETIAVALKVSTAEDRNVNVKIRDYLPPNVNQTSIIDQTAGAGPQTYCGLSPGVPTVSSDALAKNSDYVEWNNATLDKQERYLCYTFEVPEQSDYLSRPDTSGQKSPPKNDVFQVRAVAISSITDRVLASSNNYIMIKGYPWATTEPTEVLGSSPPNDDDLAFSFTSALFKDPITSENKNLGGNPSYIYKRGLGPNSRGGTLVSLPVRMTNGTGDTLLSMDPFYLLYNPAFYIFGNIFSGSSSLSTAFDFNSKSNAVSSGLYNSSDKLNAAAALYNYFFDKNSVLFWKSENNPQMQDNLNRILAGPADVVCAANAGDTDNLKSGHGLYLKNQNCQIQQATTNQIWPTGRIWYFKPTTDVDLGATIWETGTIILDFSGASGPKSVYIKTKDNNFQNNAKLGLIVLNGSVIFTKEAERFDGLVFAPGDNGKIIFEADGNPIKIHGSLVANQIQFASRNKNGQKYSVAIYSDSSILNIRLPGFERLMDIIVSNQ